MRSSPLYVLCNLRFCQWRGNASWRKERRGEREREREEEEGERDTKERGKKTDREKKGDVERERERERERREGGTGRKKGGTEIKELHNEGLLNLYCSFFFFFFLVC
jgi:hypothetical protein